MKDPTIFDMAKKFNLDIKTPELLKAQAENRLIFDNVVKEINDWINLHKDAVLLAWFAQYGFEPGKAVLVTDGINTVIREWKEGDPK